MNSVISITCSTRKIDSFYKYLLAQLQSMKENSNLDIPIIIHYDNMTEKQQINLVKVNNNITEFRKIPLEKYIRFRKNSPGWFALEGWSIKNYDKVIIMDSDFICQGDISALITGDYEIGMCQEGSGIFNAGLVVATKKLLAEDWYWKMLSSDHDKVHIGGNRDKFSKDQKLINVWLKPRIKALPRMYNWLVSDCNALKSRMVHYIYKPFYEVGRKQLNERNPNFLKVWENYYNKALEVING
jgi:hypothetical protein